MKNASATLVCIFARLLNVPIKVRESYWLGGKASPNIDGYSASANPHLPAGLAHLPNERPASAL